MESILIKQVRKYILYLIVFMCGVYITSIFLLSIHSNYESRLFERVAKRVVGDYESGDVDYFIKNNQQSKGKLTDIQKVIALNEFTHEIMGPPRKGLFLPKNKTDKGIIDKYLHSSSIAIIGGYACGMHSQVFGRFVETLGFDYRNYSMWNNGKNHNVAEVKIDSTWIVFDPLFNQVFKNEKGKLVGVQDIRDKWLFYKKQIGNNLFFDYTYDMDYNYEKRNKEENVLISNLKDGVLFFWSKLLNYKSSDDIKQQMNLDKYFFWKIISSSIFILMNICFIVIYFAIGKLQN